MRLIKLFVLVVFVTTVLLILRNAGSHPSQPDAVAPSPAAPSPTVPAVASPVITQETKDRADKLIKGFQDANVIGDVRLHSDIVTIEAGPEFNGLSYKDKIGVGIAGMSWGTCKGSKVVAVIFVDAQNNHKLATFNCIDNQLTVE